MTKYQIIDFPLYEDDRGTLVPFELGRHFPFEVLRVYLVTAKEGQTRGGHAHKIESEMFVAASGRIKVRINDGAGDEEIILDSQKKGLIVHPHCWHEFYDFSPDAVMLCFSSTHYLPGENNYVSDKDIFLNSTT